MWLSPDDIFDVVTNNGVQDCSIVLFVIAERVPKAKKYRNAYETIRQRVVDHIAEAPRPRFRQTIPDLSAELPLPSRGCNDLALDDGSQKQLSQILADMSGAHWQTAWEAPFSLDDFATDYDLGSILGMSEI